MLPDGIEAGTLRRLPDFGYVSLGDDRFVCGKPMPDVGSGEVCWVVPGHGIAHGDCYEPEDDDA